MLKSCVHMKYIFSSKKHRSKINLLFEESGQSLGENLLIDVLDSDRLHPEIKNCIKILLNLVKSTRYSIKMNKFKTYLTVVSMVKEGKGSLTTAE